MGTKPSVEMLHNSERGRGEWAVPMDTAAPDSYAAKKSIRVLPISFTVKTSIRCTLMLRCNSNLREISELEISSSNKPLPKDEQ